MNGTTGGVPAKQSLDTTVPTEPPTALDLFALFLRIGATSFGMTMLENLRQVVMRRGLLSEQEMREGLALVQLYPGPIMFDLVAFIGYRRRGTAGAIAAATGFILPATLLMLTVAWAYTQFGSLPSLKRLSLGLSALVVGIMAHITFDFARKNLTGLIHAVLAVTAFIATLAQVDPVMVIFMALAIGAIALRTEANQAVSETVLSWRRLVAPLVVAGIVLGAVLAAVLIDSSLSQLALAFFKIGATAFGNAATILPVMQAVVVSQHRWLAPAEFNLAVALGNLTPGPVLNSATFVGYRVAGLLGGLAATIAVFAPSFAMTLLMSELYERVRRWGAVRAAIQGVVAAFVGLLAGTTLSMAQPIANDVPAIIVAAVAFTTMVAGVPLIWVLVVGLPIWWIATP
jgi:chromate transporter